MLDAANYNDKRFEDLKDKLNTRIAYLTNKSYSSDRYNLSIKTCLDQVFILSGYIEILDDILHCSNCYKDFDEEEIVTKITTQLYK